MKASEVLRKAKSLIDKPEKWLQRDLGHPGVGHCIHGAINMITCGTPEYIAGSCWQPHEFIRAAIGGDILSYNNHPNRTHSEIMDAFTRAIALAEKEEGVTRLSDADYTKRFLESITTGTLEDVATAK